MVKSKVTRTFAKQRNTAVGTASVFICANTAAAEGRSVAVIDFPGAYLNEMPQGSTPIYMKVLVKYLLRKINDASTLTFLMKAGYGP